MAQNGFVIKNKISLKQSTTAGDTAGDIRYDGSGNLQLRDGSGEKTILDQDNSVTVTNKSIDADNNTITNLAHGAEVDNPSSGVHGVTGSVVGTTDTQTLTNKTIDADLNTVTNIENADIKAAAAIDATKIADGSVTNTEFQYIGGLTSDAQTQISSKITAPSSTDNAVAKYDGTNGAVQNTAVLIDDSNNITGVNDLTVGNDLTVTGNLTVNGTTTTVNTATLEVEDANITLNNNGTQSSADTADAGITIEMSDATDAIIHYDSTSSTKWKVGEVGSTAEIVDASTAQTLTNKTLTAPVIDAASLTEQSSTPSTPSSGTKKFYAKNDGKLYTLDSAGNEIEVGSGAGGGGVFYINEDFETGVASLVAYADAAGTSPVDATGGSPNITVSIESASPLIGDQSAQIAKDAANRQGEGVAITSETVDEAYEDKVHTVEFLWKTDANYADGDMSLWVVHPTTGTVEALYFRTALGEYTNELPKSDTTVTRIVSELTPIDATYKIVIHVASTSATAYEVFVDDIKCGPQRTFNAALVTEWESYTPTGSWVSNATYTGKYRRVGDSAEIRIKVALSGAPTSAALTVDLPTGLSIDTNKVVTSDTTLVFPESEVRIYDAGSGWWSGALRYSDTNTFSVLYVDGTSVYAAVTQAAPMTFTTSDAIEIYVKVPISGWDAGAAFSTTQVDQQTLKVAARDAGSQVITADVTDITFNEVTDTNNAWNGTQFTAPKAGRYTVHGMVRFTAAAARNLYLYTASQTKFIQANNASSSLHSFSGEIDLDSGEVMSLRTDSGGTLSTGVGSTHHITITAQPDFTVFGTFPDKIVEAVYEVTSSSSNTSIADNSAEIIDYDSKVVDSHNAVTTGVSWKFTAPRTSTYYLEGALQWATNANLNSTLIQLYKNNSLYRPLRFTASNELGVQYARALVLQEGDTIDIRVTQDDSASAARTIETGAVYTYISIRSKQ